MLTQTQVDRVRELLAKGLSFRQASLVTGVSRGSVHNIAIDRPLTCFTRKLHGGSMKKLSEATKRKLFDTRHLSVAESAGITKQTQDAVRQWRRKHGYHETRPIALRYTLSVGERVMWYDRKSHQELTGRIIAIQGKRYQVDFGAGHQQWLGEQALAAMPTLEEIAERAYKIKMRNIELMATAG